MGYIWRKFHVKNVKTELICSNKHKLIWYHYKDDQSNTCDNISQKLPLFDAQLALDFSKYHGSY